MLLLPLLIHLFRVSAGVIYRLNDTEYSRMPSLYALDEYEPCVSEVGGLYCVAKFEVYSDSPNDLIDLIQEYSKLSLKHFNHSEIDKGICITKSCVKDTDKINPFTTADLKRTLEECVNKTIWREHGVQAKLKQLYYCNKHKEIRNIDLLDWAVAATCLGIIFVNIMGSYYDHVYSSKYEGKFPSVVYECIACFSVQRNLSKLLETGKSPPQIKYLQGFHGTRSIFMLVVVMAHCVYFINVAFTENPHSYEKSFDHRFLVMLYSGSLIVQIFFFMTGFLLTYNLQTVNKKTKLNWIDVPRIIFIRWLRLTPACGLVIAFTMTWSRHLGSGPLWKFFVSDNMAKTCRQYWWTHLLYINNYMKEGRFCALQTWSLAADMQLVILGVAVHVATRYRGRILSLAILSVVGMAIPAFYVWLYDLDAQVLLNPEFFRTFTDEEFFTYIQGHHNIPCFISGMATGYLGYTLQERGTDLSEYKICRLLPWIFIPGIFGVIYQVSKFFANEPRASVATRMFYAATLRSAIGVLAAIWTLGMICKCNDASRAFFEWRGWKLTSNLSYCFYLIHMLVISIILGIHKQLVPVSPSYTISMYFLTLGLSFLAAIPVHLMVEAPINGLTKLMLRSQKLQVKNK